MGDRAGSIPVIRTDKKARHLCVSFFYGANVPLEPVGSMSPLCSGRRRANVHRTLCALSSAVKSPVFSKFCYFYARKDKRRLFSEVQKLVREILAVIGMLIVLVALIRLIIR